MPDNEKRPRAIGTFFVTVRPAHSIALHVRRSVYIHRLQCFAIQRWNDYSHVYPHSYTELIPQFGVFASICMIKEHRILTRTDALYRVSVDTKGATATLRIPGISS